MQSSWRQAKSLTRSDKKPFHTIPTKNLEEISVANTVIYSADYLG